MKHLQVQHHFCAGLGLLLLLEGDMMFGELYAGRRRVSGWVCEMAERMMGKRNVNVDKAGL